jgi:hypothetical protein
MGTDDMRQWHSYIAGGELFCQLHMTDTPTRMCHWALHSAASKESSLGRPIWTC